MKTAKNKVPYRFLLVGHNSIGKKSFYYKSKNYSKLEKLKDWLITEKGFSNYQYLSTGTLRQLKISTSTFTLVK